MAFVFADEAQSVRNQFPWCVQCAYGPTKAELISTMSSFQTQLLLAGWTARRVDARSCSECCLNSVVYLVPNV